MPKKTPAPEKNRPRFRRYLGASLAVFILGIAIVVWWKKETISIVWQRLIPSIPGIKKIESPVPDQARWELLQQDLKRWRIHYAQQYRNAKTAQEKYRVLHKCRELLEHSLPEMMRCWLGTAWDFNGTAVQPGAGKIACGYFVSTILEGADFQVTRTQLAQQASQNILRTFVDDKDMRLRVGVPYKTFAAETSRSEPGIYIVGLDTHVGFLVVKDQTFHMIHSSGSIPWCVVEENPDQAHVLERSNYRVLANITANDAVIRRWLLGETFTTFR